MFLRGDVKPAQDLTVRFMGEEREADLLRTARSWDLAHAGTTGMPREWALSHRVALVTQGRLKPEGAYDTESWVTWPKPAEMVSTPQIKWYWTNSARGVVTIDSPFTKAVIGFGGGQKFQLSGFDIEPGEGAQNGWCAITVTKTDRAPTRPSRWLITATGYADNMEMQWKNPEKSTVGRDWGKAPSRVEGVSARISLPAGGPGVRAWALDERGQRREAVKLPESAVLTIGPQLKTLWYEVEWP
jgi:hypothetical protein